MAALTGVAIALPLARLGQRPLYPTMYSVIAVNALAMRPCDKANEAPMTTCVFVQIRCRPGTTYKVADQITLKEIHSELYSTSGDYDLLMKIYIPEGADVGHFINESVADIDGIERTLTTLTFKAF